MSYGMIYKITCLVNGKSYIGQTVQTLKERWRAHATKNSECLALRNAIQFHSKANFEITEICQADSKEELDRLEIHYIDFYKSLTTQHGYNISLGGNGGGKHSPERNAAKSVRQTGKKLKPRTQEHCDNIAAAKTGKKLKPRTQEHRTAQSIALTGKKKSPEHCSNLSIALTGRKLSLKTRANMSAARKGKPGPNTGKRASQETRNRMSIAQKLRHSIGNKI
jgi:group I intron endonuclease